MPVVQITLTIARIQRNLTPAMLVLCQVLELGLCATGFASAGRQYTTLMYTGTASGTPKLKLDTALDPRLRRDDRTLIHELLGSHAKQLPDFVNPLLTSPVRARN